MFYIVKVRTERYDTMLCKSKNVTDQVIVEGERFGDVENVATPIYGTMNATISICTENGYQDVNVNRKTNLKNAEFDVISIARTKYREVIGNVSGLVQHTDERNAQVFDATTAPSSKWYKCRIGYDATSDSGKDIRVHGLYLVGASSIEQARDAIAEHCEIGNWNGYGVKQEIECVDETKISDVYILKPSENND